jgi:hypothetical protein
MQQLFSLIVAALIYADFTNGEINLRQLLFKNNNSTIHKFSDSVFDYFDSDPKDGQWGFNESSNFFTKAKAFGLLSPVNVTDKVDGYDVNKDGSIGKREFFDRFTAKLNATRQELIHSAEQFKYNVTVFQENTKQAFREYYEQACKKSTKSIDAVFAYFQTCLNSTATASAEDCVKNVCTADTDPHKVAKANGILDYYERSSMVQVKGEGAVVARMWIEGFILTVLLVAAVGFALGGMPSVSYALLIISILPLVFLIIDGVTYFTVYRSPVSLD